MYSYQNNNDYEWDFNEDVTLGRNRNKLLFKKSIRKVTEEDKIIINVIILIGLFVCIFNWPNVADVFELDF